MEDPLGAIQPFIPRHVLSNLDDRFEIALQVTGDSSNRTEEPRPKSVCSPCCFRHREWYLDPRSQAYTSKYPCNPKFHL